MLADDFRNLLDEYKNKQNIPSWMRKELLLKTLLNKNITIEEWNTLVNYISNLSSENNTLIKLVELIGNAQIGQAGATFRVTFSDNILKFSFSNGESVEIDLSSLEPSIITLEELDNILTDV